MDKVFLLLMLPTVTSKGSHSLSMLLTYTEGKTQFPVFTGALMLDDITVGHFDSKTFTFIPQGNTINEDDVVSSDNVKIIIEYLFDCVIPKMLSNEIGGIFYNQKESPNIVQAIAHCEVGDNGKPGRMIFAVAFRGCTVEKQHFFNNTFTCQGVAHEKMKKYRPEVDGLMLDYASKYYPTCITLLRSYLKKRGSQVNRRVKPTIRLIQKTNKDSGGFQVSCLATGFYPRHINLTLYRDGQPVADDEVTGGQLLPNDDGTYQMRKTLDISAEEQREKHKYSCTASHLSLDNKLDIRLEYHGKLLTSDPDSVLGVFVAFSIVFILCIVIVYRNESRVGFWICVGVSAMLIISQLRNYLEMFKALHKIYTLSWDNMDE